VFFSLLISSSFCVALFFAFFFFFFDLVRMLIVGRESFSSSIAAASFLISCCPRSDASYLAWLMSSLLTSSSFCVEFIFAILFFFFDLVGMLVCSEGDVSSRSVLNSTWAPIVASTYVPIASGLSPLLAWLSCLEGVFSSLIWLVCRVEEISLKLVWMPLSLYGLKELECRLSV